MAPKQNLSFLLSPFQLKGQNPLKLANRVVMAPLTRARADPHTRIANSYMAKYYEMRASAGLIIGEATAVSDMGHGWYGAPALYTHDQALGWKLSVDAVHAQDGKIFAQLWHMGRQSHPSFHHHTIGLQEVVAPSAIKVPIDSLYTRDANNQPAAFVLPRALETKEIPDLIADYCKSASLAMTVSGFDGIELHCANGYLLDTFLQSVTNTRTDQYGGSVANRCRLILELLDAMTEIVPLDRVGIRISPNGGFGGMGSSDNVETFTYLANALSHYPLAYLHVMDGQGFGSVNHLCRPLTLYEMKKAFDEGPIMANVAFTKETAEGVLRSGAADLIAFGRPFISNPDLVERFANDWPLAPDADQKEWWTAPEKEEDLPKGYLTYLPFQPPLTSVQP